MFQPIKLKPGIDRSNTTYAREGGWYDCNHVRFFYETPQKIGGWVKFSNSTFAGYARSAHVWSTLAGNVYLGMGTSAKYYIVTGGTLYDITPISKTSTVTDPFTTTDGSADVNVNHISNRAQVGDYISISGATAVGGITLSGEYEVKEIVDDDNYVVTHSSAATSAASGGGSVTIVYYASSSKPSATTPIGWGEGPYGGAPWNASSIYSVLNTFNLWTEDNFGEDLIFSVYNGPIYYWDATSGHSTRAVKLASMEGANEVPSVATQIMVTDDRHVVAFGANPIGSLSQDPLFVRWSDQEDPFEWYPSATNTAGGQRLDAGTRIITAIEADRQNLIWTDAALYSMQAVGGEYVFSFNAIAYGVTPISPNACVIIDNIVFWMGIKKFHFFNGSTDILPCTVLEYVFNDFNYSQAYQVYAGVNRRYNEVWWFYPSSSATVNDRYVVFNYKNNTWYYGSMGRTAWIDDSTENYPIAATVSGNLVYHEYGVDDSEGDTPVAIEAFVESSDFDIQNGDRYLFLRKIIPDVDFSGSTADEPTVTFTVSGRTEPGTNYTTADSGDTTRTTTSPVDQHTNQLHVRLRARQAKIKISSSDVGVQWKLGAPRIEGRPDGGKI